MSNNLTTNYALTVRTNQRDLSKSNNLNKNLSPNKSLGFGISPELNRLLSVPAGEPLPPELGGIPKRYFWIPMIIGCVSILAYPAKCLIQERMERAQKGARNTAEQVLTKDQLANSSKQAIEKKFILPTQQIKDAGQEVEKTCKVVFDKFGKAKVLKNCIK